MSARDATPVAVLGLGAMGSRVASRLLDAGFPLTIWNRTPSAAEGLATSGARVALDPAACATGARVVLVCVRDDAASEQLWEQVRPGLGTDAVAVDLSTVTAEHARTLAERIGPAFLAAPMVGSRPQVEAGQLQLLVGGDPATLEQARDVLEAAAGGVHHVGSVGDAAVLKLVVNGLLAAQLAAVGELLALVRRAGLDEAKAAELLAALPVASPAVARSVPRVLARDTTPSFPVELAEKDIGYLLGEAGRSPLLQTVQGSLRRRIADGGGDHDIVALAMPGAN